MSALHAITTATTVAAATRGTIHVPGSVCNRKTTMMRMMMIRIQATASASASAGRKASSSTLIFLKPLQHQEQHQQHQQLRCCNVLAAVGQSNNISRHCYSTAAVLGGRIADFLLLGIHHGRNLTTSTARTHDDDHDKKINTESKIRTTAGNNNGNVVVYESPFGSLVTKLRVVSLMTGIFGSIGLPLATTMSSGITPSTGFVALCVTFGTGTIGTTLAIQYVFGPYVYSIERIPIRKCHYKKTTTTTTTSQQNINDTDTSADNDETTTKTTLATNALTKEEAENTNNTAPISCTTSGPHFLYMAKSKSIFIRPVETVFDAHDDVQKYTGFTLPLCNFTAKGRALYMHTEYLRDDKLYSRMQMIENDNKKKYKTPPKENPDDDFL